MTLAKGIISLIITLVFTLSSSWAQSQRYTIRGGKKVPLTARIDSTLHDSLMRDSLMLIHDSLRRDTVYSDSLGRIILDSVSASKFKYSKADSLSLLKPQIPLAANSILRNKQAGTPITEEYVRRKFSLTRDTISAGAHFGLSLIPGLGQIYNRQAWKAPIFYAGIGAFLTAGIITSNQFTTYRNQWQHSVNMNQPSEVTNPLKRKMENAGSTRTIMYSLAAATYLYQLADATFNYRGHTNPVRKATILAAIFPGAGFIYTKTYWRLPIYYGGFIALGTVVDYNNRSYQRYQKAYNALTDGDPTTIDEFRGRYSSEALKNVRDGYRRDRDFGIICLSAAYLLSIIDTYVISTLKNWDVSSDLSMKIEPAFFDNPHSQFASAGLPGGAGLALKLRF